MTSPLPVGKGKQRAVESDEPTETSPLLGSSSADQQNGEIIILDTTPRDSLNFQWKTLLRSFLIGLGLAITMLIVAFLIVLARLHKDVSVEDAVRWKIDDVRVINASAPSDPLSMWINAKASIWLDFDDQALDPWQIKVLNWGLRTLESVNISPSPISIRPRDKRVSKYTLLTLEVPPFNFPLPQSLSEKQTISVPLHAIPTSNISAAVKTIEHSWALRQLELVACASSVSIQGVEGWRKMLSLTQQSLEVPMSFTIPPIPFLPPPPAPLLKSFASLVHLSKVSLFQSRTVSAIASIPNPLPYLLKGLPPLEVVINPTIVGTVYLPPPESDDESDADPLPIVAATPLSMVISSTTANLTVPIEGSIHSIPNTPVAELQLSTFLSAYLGGLPTPIIIHTLGKWIPFDLPARKRRPKLIDHITLHDVRFALRSDGAVVHGNINVIVSLPPGFDLDLDVKRVTVDLIAYDGPVPSPSQNFSGHRTPILPFPHLPHIHLPTLLPSPSHRKPNETLPDRPSPPVHPPPHPLPPLAFARIRPPTWLNATSTLLPELPDDEVPTSRYEVNASFHDVPLDILPGRDSVFRSFVRKFVFKKEAELGIKGFVGVGVVIPGLIEDQWSVREFDGEKGVLELLDLPVESNVMVSRNVL